MIKDIKINKNRNNINGVFSIKDKKFFYKILSLSDYENERAGYEIIKGMYPVANLIFNGIVNNNKSGLLIYEFEETIGKNRGLLIDIFSNSNNYDSDSHLLNKILFIYKFMKKIFWGFLFSRHEFKNAYI